eukprot:TRINITY_DN3661_c0_g2_i1.p1 TRINITY_DN3661_c0_g2~~TRINITY_DN3661_c0_g2_i1.p1  ORF type:complete len:277 (+),score=122.08 TRINITY_DN3661_c0_g2_i1:101-832(+)
MNDAEARRQIEQMVEFIRQEAKEKEEEIQVKTEEEYNYQKLNMIVASKVKIREEYKKKEEALQIKKRIDRSVEVNQARLQKMRIRDDIVLNCKDLAAQRLAGASTHARYSELIKALIVQGLLRLQEPQVSIQCRQQDKALVQSLLAGAVAQYRQLMQTMTNKNVDCVLTIDNNRSLPAGPSADNTGATCLGGVVLLGLDNRIAVDNTLDSRLDLAFEQLKPQVRETLFGQRPKPVRRPEEHHH